MSNVQNPYDIPLYWLVNRNPSNGKGNNPNNHFKCFSNKFLEHKSASSAPFLTSNLGSSFGSGSRPLVFIFLDSEALLAFGSKSLDRLRERIR